MRVALFVKNIGVVRVTIKLKFPLSSGVFPIAVPPLHKFEGIHGDRVAGDNTRCSHRKGHFTYYATSIAWRLRNRMPRILVQNIELRRSLFSPPCGSRYVYK